MLQGHTHKHSEGEHITGEGELPGHHGAVSESELCEGGGAPCACDQLTKGRVLDCVAGGLRGLEDFRRRVWGGGFGRGGDLDLQLRLPLLLRRFLNFRRRHPSSARRWSRWWPWGVHTGGAGRRGRLLRIHPSTRVRALDGSWSWVGRHVRGRLGSGRRQRLWVYRRAFPCCPEQRVCRSHVLRCCGRRPTRTQNE